MQTNNLPSITTKKLRRVGQGHGSGRMKTAGRGTKGQKARTKIPLYFEGGALPLIKRMPFLRGKSRNKPFKGKAIVLNVSDLNRLPAKTTVDMDVLVKHHLVDSQEARQSGIKILGSGDLQVPLTVKLAVTKSAAAKIEKAGGSVVGQ